MRFLVHLLQSFDIAQHNSSLHFIFIWNYKTFHELLFFRFRISVLFNGKHFKSCRSGKYVPRGSNVKVVYANMIKNVYFFINNWFNFFHTCCGFYYAFDHISILKLVSSCYFKVLKSLHSICTLYLHKSIAQITVCKWVQSVTSKQHIIH